MELNMVVRYRKEGEPITPTGLTGYTVCNVCGEVIAKVRQIEIDTGFDYIKENMPNRYIDRWGYERNFCKKCMKAE